MELKILNSDLKMQGVVKNPDSFWWVKKFYTYGNFELHVPFSKAAAKILKAGNSVLFKNNLGIIIDSDGSKDPQSNEITVTGLSALSLLTRRIIVPDSGLAYDSASGTVETVMKHYVEHQAVSPVDTSRIEGYFKNLVIGDTQGIGSEISSQKRYSNLGSELDKIAATNYIGHDIVYDYDLKKLVYQVYEGLDRSYSQSVNSRVIFSEKFKNIQTNKYLENIANYKNVAYVGGSGTGTSRTIAVVDSSDSLGRFETFMDASDTSDTTELATRGLEALAGTQKSISVDAKIKDAPFKYEQHWNLGDNVSIEVEDWDFLDNFQITAVKEVFENGNTGIEATFGTEPPTLQSALKSKFEGFESLKNV